MRTRPDYVTAFWVILGAFVCFGSYRAGLGRLLEPGAGLMPFVLGTVMCLLALLKLARRRSRSGGEKSGGLEEEMTSALRKRVGVITAITISLFAYAFLLEPIGYLITTFLVLAFLLKLAGNKHWLRVGPYAAVITLVSYYGFGYLGTRFPQGLLGLPGL